MEIRTFQEQGRVSVTVLEIHGNIDSSTANQVSTRADDALKAGTHNLLLDLTQVNYMSSAGLRILNQLFNRLHPEALGTDYAKTQKGLSDGTYKSPHLKVCGLTPGVRQVLSMSGFDMYIDVFQDRASAVAAFS